MTARDHLLQLARALPAGSSVTVPRDWVLEALEAPQEPATTPDAPGVDLTVYQVAAMFGKAPSTVRGWCKRGSFPGAYHRGGGTSGGYRQAPSRPTRTPNGPPPRPQVGEPSIWAHGVAWAGQHEKSDGRAAVSLPRLAMRGDLGSSPRSKRVRAGGPHGPESGPTRRKFRWPQTLAKKRSPNPRPHDGSG